jgi:hypothetical protein
MILRSVVTVLALAFTASAAAAQETEVLPGARIRVAQPVFVDGVDIGRVHPLQVGTLVSVDSASITALLEKDGTLLTLPFSAINRLEISQGAVSGDRARIHRMRTGAIVGGGLTAAIYGLAAYINAADDKLDEECGPIRYGSCGAGGRFELPYMVPAIVGATIGGAAIGFRMGSREGEAWKAVRPRTLRPVAAPSDLSLTVSLRF